MALVPNMVLNNDVQIPQLGFGVFQVPPDQVVDAVGTALDSGYRLIDTAAAYGNEEGVGRAIAGSGVPRDEIFVTTKVWNNDHGYDKTLKAFDASRSRLGLDVLDMYLIHWPTPARDNFGPTWEALEKIYAEGQARAVGVCNFTATHLRQLLAMASVVPAVNQIELHPGFPQNESQDFHSRHGIVTEAWSPIGAGKGLLDDPAVAKLAAAHGVSPAQAVLRWHIQMGNVAIPKSVTPERIRSNIDVFGFQLTEEEVAVLSGLGTNQRLGPDPDQFNDS